MMLVLCRGKHRELGIFFFFLMIWSLLILCYAAHPSAVLRIPLLPTNHFSNLSCLLHCCGSGPSQCSMLNVYEGVPLGSTSEEGEEGSRSGQELGSCGTDPWRGLSSPGAEIGVQDDLKLGWNGHARSVTACDNLRKVYSEVTALCNWSIVWKNWKLMAVPLTLQFTDAQVANGSISLKYQCSHSTNIIYTKMDMIKANVYQDIPFYHENNKWAKLQEWL